MELGTCFKNDWIEMYKETHLFHSRF